MKLLPKLPTKDLKASEFGHIYIVAGQSTGAKNIDYDLRYSVSKPRKKISENLRREIKKI